MVWIPKGIKDLLKRTRLYQRYTEERVCRNWTLSGKPIPPPEAVKHRIIRAYAKKFKTPIFIETGTYRGETLQAVGHAFRRAYSIELSPELFRAARKRFANCSRISLLEGDSGEVLSQILSTIHEPCLFWLDAHYCFRGTAKGEQYTPIRKELGHIFARPHLRSSPGAPSCDPDRRCQGLHGRGRLSYPGDPGERGTVYWIPSV